MEKTEYIKFIPDEESMLEFGNQLGHVLLRYQAPSRVMQESKNASVSYLKLDSPFIFFLYGQLGAGKTTLVRGFLRGLGYGGRVKSPTYTLVESYEVLIGTVFHFDLYRLHTPEELESIGIQDYFIPWATCIIEWPEHGKGLLPLPDLSCYISLHDNSREIKLTAQTACGKTIIELFR